MCVTLQDVYQQTADAEKPLAQWLPQWHGGMLNVIEVERNWLALQLPEQQPALFLQVPPICSFCHSCGQMPSHVQASWFVTMT